MRLNARSGISSLALAVFVASLTFPVGVFADLRTDFNNAIFSDVSIEDDHFNAIYFLQNTDVISGYTNSDSELAEYRPENSINRAEFLKIVYEGNDLATHEAYDDCFPDVPADVWFNTYVCQAKEEGVVSGYPDGNFKPEETINEVEALKILSEVGEWETAEVNDGVWYQAYLDLAEEKNLAGFDDPSTLMTRGDIAEMIFRNTQIDALKLESYSEDYDATLFAMEDIPFENALAPGGLLGPGGAFGIEGAFSESGLLSSDETVLLEEDFFETHACYYSDEGEFSGDALEFLQTFTQEDLDIYSGGSSPEDFGLMFCYDEEQEIDLALFTEELRDEYQVVCWDDPLLPVLGSEEADEILCYVDSDGGVASFPYYLEVIVEEMDTVEAAFDDEGVSVMRFTVGSLGTENTTLSGITLHSFGALPYSAIDRLTLQDDAGNVLFDERMYPWDWWNEDSLQLNFDAPVEITPESGKRFELTADLDWEDNDGEVWLGFTSAGDLLTPAIVDLGLHLNGALLTLVLPLEEEEKEEGTQACLLKSEADAEAETVEILTMNIEVAELDEDSHDVIPVNLGGEACFANAVYSSWRWLEEFLERDDLIENGEEGRQKIVDALNPPGGFFFGWMSQFEALKSFIKNHPMLNACVNLSWNTNWGKNVTCEELKAYFDQSCDVPLNLSCLSKASGKGWGHTVDLVDIELDPDDSNKCKLTVANSWGPPEELTAEEAAEQQGEVASPSLDGFDPGTYEVGTYDYDTGLLDIATQWGNAYNCTLESAIYMCPSYTLDCMTPEEINESIVLPEEN